MNWREWLRADNRLLMALFGDWRGRVYLYVAALTLVSQLPHRWETCAGALSCSLSFGKGAVWSIVWPFYWINYATKFDLFQW